MKKFQMTLKQWKSVNNQLRKDCIDYLKDVLIRKGSPLVFDVGCQYVTVVYDGGNHSEYASNAFSLVNSVFTDNGEIYLDIEDCNRYSIDRICASELYDVCDYIASFIDKDTYLCRICGKEKDWESDTIWISSSFGVCSDCYDKIPEEIRERISEDDYNKNVVRFLDDIGATY